MGIPRTPKVAQEQWFRRLDELIERNSHQVFVMQDKRALRDEARRVGVELVVGDPENVKGGLSRGKTLADIAKKHGVSVEHLEKQLAAGVKVETEHTSSPKAARKIAMDHLVEDANYYTKLRRMEKSSMLNLEKAKKGEDVFPHKYIEKHVTPSGNVVYVYADDLRRGVKTKQTGFQSGRPGAEPVEPPGELGAKRKRVTEGMAGAPPEAQTVVEHGLTHPGDTVRNMQLVLHNMYGGDRAAMMKDVQKTISQNKHLQGLPKEEQQGYVTEAIVRSHLLEHPEWEIPKPHTGDQAMTGHLKGKSAYVMHPDVTKRQPWQLTGDQYKARQSMDPELGNKAHADVVKEAHARGELIPAKVLEEHPDVKQDYFKDHPKLELSPETQKYVEKFDRLSEKLPKTFHEWVHNDVQKMGDALLTEGKTSGYNVDEIEGYDVGDADVYSHMMTAPKTVIMYHMYAQHADHGRQMLAILHENGLDPKYTVVRRASAVKWDNTWTEEPELTYRPTKGVDDQGKPNRIAYSSDYILAFLPSSKEQGEAIYKMLAKHGNKTESDYAIPNSFYVPDVRSSQKVDDFERRYLNVKRMGSQELCVLTREDWIHKEGEAPQSKEEVMARRDEDYHPEFVRDYVWLGRRLSRQEISENQALAEQGQGPKHGTLAQFIKSQNKFGEVIFVNL